MAEPTKPTTPAQPAKPAATASDPSEPTKPAENAQAGPQSVTISPEDAAELAAYRAEKARKEAAAKAAVKPDGTANLDLDPKSDAFRTLSIDNQIRAHYLHARGTIQDYARLFSKTVPEVLEILDIRDMAEVEQIGDLIGSDELGKGDAPVRMQGEPHKVPFSIN